MNEYDFLFSIEVNSITKLGLIIYPKGLPDFKIYDIMYIEMNIFLR